VLSRKDALSVRRARHLARAIVEHHFGTPPARLLHKGSGLTNFVFEVKHAQAELIVRLSDEPAKLGQYLKEQWASERARAAGVPTAEILEVGNEVVPHPYMIARRVRGAEATHHPREVDIVRQLGGLVRQIHGIQTHGFGRTFDWSSNTLSKYDTWPDYLTRGLRVEERIEALERMQILPVRSLRALRRTVHEIERWDRIPALNHTDLRLKNVIVDEAGQVAAIIDWEDCESNVAPIWDLAFALHDLGIDAKEAFVQGYGLRSDELMEMAPAMRAFNVLGYVPTLEAMAAARDDAGLDRYRARLAGALDLYSL